MAVSLTPVNSLSAVLLNNLSPVSTTLAIKFFPGVVDTGQKEPKGLKFIAGVNDTAEKLLTGVKNTTDKFFGGVNDTGE